jgi:hypothetical protein
MQAVSVFIAMQTQWRVGMGGAVGLDYSALPAVLDLEGITEGKRELFSDIRVMESAALEQMRRDHG